MRDCSCETGLICRYFSPLAENERGALFETSLSLSLVATVSNKLGRTFKTPRFLLMSKSKSRNLPRFDGSLAYSCIVIKISSVISRHL